MGMSRIKSTFLRPPSKLHFGLKDALSVPLGPEFGLPPGQLPGQRQTLKTIHKQPGTQNKLNPPYYQNIKYRVGNFRLPPTSIPGPSTINVK